MIIGILINFIVWPLIISWLWKARKTEKELKRGYDDYNEPENKFKRRNSEIGITLNHFYNTFKYPYVLIPSYKDRLEASFPKYVDFEEDLEMNYPLKRNKKITEGKSEYFLYTKLIEKFGDEFILLGSYSISKFYPDIIYQNIENRIFIDIEIDEPYSLKNNKPIHYFHFDKENNRNIFFDSNKIRDERLLKSGWTIIHFSEEQVLKFPEVCVDIINHIVCYWLQEKSPYIFENSKMKLTSRWSFEDAKLMSKNKFRNTYL